MHQTKSQRDSVQPTKLWNLKTVYRFFCWLVCKRRKKEREKTFDIILLLWYRMAQVCVCGWMSIDHLSHFGIYIINPTRVSCDWKSGLFFQRTFKFYSLKFCCCKIVRREVFATFSYIFYRIFHKLRWAFNSPTPVCFLNISTLSDRFGR